MRVPARLAGAGALFFLVLNTLLLSYSLALWWGERHNTLFDNGRWIVGKDTGKYVFYSYKFMFRPLKKSKVFLNDDMAYQEILYREGEGPRRRLEGLKFKGMVSAGGYLWIEVRKVGQKMAAFRLSRNKEYRSGYYRYGDGGDLVEYLPLDREPGRVLQEWKNIELSLKEGRWHLDIEGLSLGSFPDTGPRDGRFGFRGSGSTRRKVGLGKMEMRFRDPERRDRTWTEREDFKPSFAASGRLEIMALFSLSVLALRLWRRRVLGGFLPEGSRKVFTRYDEAGLTALLLLCVVLPRPAEGFHIPAVMALAEVPCLVGFAVGLHRRGEMSALPSRRLVVPFAVTMILVSAAAFTTGGEALGRASRVTWGKMKYVHPDAYILRPGRQQSSGAFVLEAPREISLGRPFFIERRAYREQSIVADFIMPRAGTLDVIFQQQSFSTRGDPEGEALPLQRRLLRLSTRKDTPWGFSREIRRAPAPFYRVRGDLLPGGENHLELRADGRGVLVLLNGVETRLPGITLLGYGETGFMVYDDPATLTSLRVEATAARAREMGLFPLLGAFLPLLVPFATWVLLRLSGGAAAGVAAAGLSAFYPLAFAMAAAIFLGRENLLFMGSDRLLWQDLLLAAAAVSCLYPVVLFRRRIKAAALWYNLCLAGACLGVAVFFWDRLPPEHGLKQKFSPETVAPGKLVKIKDKGKSGPWYGYGRLISINNYVWRQRFGGREVAPEKLPGTVRIFALGGSQAWGSGAAGSRATYDALVEKKLKERGLPVEIFNSGVNGAGISKVHMFTRDLISSYSPDVLIVDIGLNDSAGIQAVRGEERAKRHMDILVSHFEKLLGLCRESGIDLVLVREAMSRESPLRPHGGFYDAVTKLTRDAGMPVIDAIPVMWELETDHFVWWDTAHLAPFGHQALAGLLEPVVAAVVEKRLAGEHPARPDGEKQ